MGQETFAPAIKALQSELETLETKAREIKNTINVLCRHAGISELYPNVTEMSGSASISTIKGDTFYGKTIGTAAREYLEMRRASGLGPSSPKEIYEALIQGGFQFDTKSETNAQISLSNTLRKNSKTFHRLPSGLYGLLSWYPNAKVQKSSNDLDNEEDDKPQKSAASVKLTAEDVSSSDVALNDQEDDTSEPKQKEN